MQKTAIIFGVNTPVGFHLAERLLSQGNRVVGGREHPQQVDTARLSLYRDMAFTSCPPSDADGVMRLVAGTHPTHVYNFRDDETANLDTKNCLDAVRLAPQPYPVQFFQAVTAEVFGNACSAMDADWVCREGDEIPRRHDFSSLPPRWQWQYLGGFFRDERTPPHPVTKRGLVELSAMEMCREYRDDYGVDSSCLIMGDFECDSGNTDARRVAEHVAKLSRGWPVKLLPLRSGRRFQWGWAEEFAEAISLLDSSAPAGDYLVCGGDYRPVSDFAHLACDYAGVPDCERIFLKSESSEPPIINKSDKIRRATGWEQQISFHRIVETMVAYRKRAYSPVADS